MKIYEVIAHDGYGTDARIALFSTIAKVVAFMTAVVAKCPDAPAEINGRTRYGSDRVITAENVLTAVTHDTTVFGHPSYRVTEVEVL